MVFQQKKRQMVASAFGEDESGGRQTRLTVEDLNYLFMMWLETTPSQFMVYGSLDLDIFWLHR